MPGLSRDCERGVGVDIAVAVPQLNQSKGPHSIPGPVRTNPLHHGEAGGGGGVKWLHTLSHIDITGNTRPDHLADMGRRKSPLLFGQISAHPRGQEKPEEEGEEDDPIERWEGWEPQVEPEDP